MRLGAHLGPVLETHYPVLGACGFMGSHVSRTARIEPVGHMPAAKDYGRLRMYRLHHR